MIVYEDFELAYRTELGINVHMLAMALSDAWRSDYMSTTGGDRDVVEITLDTLTYLYDATTSPDFDEPDNRPIALWGHSTRPRADRNAARMRGFPSPQRDSSVRIDRGHLAAHSIGGGHDLNLIPQLASLNRGWSAEGRTWRALERYCASNPGTWFFVYAMYDDITDNPHRLDYGVVLGGYLRVESFGNR